MSDSDESGVTYTDISSLFEELSDIRSPRANDYKNFELLEMLEDQYIEELSDIRSPRANDYKHFELPEMLEDQYVEVALQAPPSPDYIPGPEEPEQAPPSPDYVPGLEHADDEIVAEDQQYAEDASPTSQPPEYGDPVDYLTDGEDDGDDEEGSSEDDDMDVEADEEEEHLAPADSIVVASTAA
nr:hypothetical protein [Tanacetum cinerariifolium]